MDVDSSDYDPSSPSTVSLVSRHVHQLQLDLHTLQAHIQACERRIIALEQEVALLRAQAPEPTWRALLLRPFAVCFQR